MLESDPIADLKNAAVELGPDGAQLVLLLLQHLLAECQSLYQLRTFGKCGSCRYFESGRSDSASGHEE